MVLQMKTLTFALFLMLLGTTLYMQRLDASAHQISVIVNMNNATEVMSAREVRKLFLGKSRKLPDGSRALLVSNDLIRSEFNRSALGKADSQVKAAWSRLLFSGRAKRPVAFSDPADVVQFVSANVNAVGYVLSSELRAGVKSVHTLK